MDIDIDSQSREVEESSIKSSMSWKIEIERKEEEEMISFIVLDASRFVRFIFLCIKMRARIESTSTVPTERYQNTFVFVRVASFHPCWKPEGMSHSKR